MNTDLNCECPLHNINDTELLIYNCKQCKKNYCENCLFQHLNKKEAFCHEIKLIKDKSIIKEKEILPIEPKNIEKMNPLLRSLNDIKDTYSKMIHDYIDNLNGFIVTRNEIIQPNKSIENDNNEKIQNDINIQNMIQKLIAKKKFMDEFFNDIKNITNKYKNFKSENYFDSIRKKEEPKMNQSNNNTTIYSNNNMIKSNDEINNIDIKNFDDLEVNKGNFKEDINKIKTMDIEEEIDVRELVDINNTNIEKTKNKQKENIKDLNTAQNNSIDNDESSDLFGDKFKMEMEAKIIEYVKTKNNQIQSANPHQGKIFIVNNVNKSYSAQNDTDETLNKRNKKSKKEAKDETIRKKSKSKRTKSKKKQKEEIKGNKNILEKSEILNNNFDKDNYINEPVLIFFSYMISILKKVCIIVTEIKNKNMVLTCFSSNEIKHKKIFHYTEFVPYTQSQLINISNNTAFLVGGYFLNYTIEKGCCDVYRIHYEKKENDNIGILHCENLKNTKFQHKLEALIYSKSHNRIFVLSGSNTVKCEYGQLNNEKTDILQWTEMQHNRYPRQNCTSCLLNDRFIFFNWRTNTI